GAERMAWSTPIAVGLFSLWMPIRIFAQDLHFSHFYLHPIALNPAATGVFEGDLRFAGAYRSQWQQVPVRYNSFVAAADWKALRRNTNLLSVGLALQHDFAGDAGLSWSQAMATAAVTQAVGEHQALGVGFGFGMAQRAFDQSALTFKNQWTGDVFDPSLPKKEALLNSTGVVPTLAAGGHWHWSAADTRTHLDAGVGAMHLNRPKFSFDPDSPNRLPVRLTVNAVGGVQVAERWDVVGFAALQRMAQAQELVVGGGGRVILSTGPANFTAVQMSLALRGKDAWVPALQVERNAWTVGLSYDINTSPFQVATRRRGGFEVAVVYRRVPVAEVKSVKTCPIF
ncbi:MAG TPA: PorP/SprF family type IX secretion system membrane protein, partial [Saprospiraceae bacterium]|nr:PorP/SprF family type IX secretion system membrane protein [Saprospiraceae bacterium]